jgi:hypothetical protein
LEYGGCHSLRRSALRLSQPHSGFRNVRTPWPCFMPQPLVGLPPFRAFPSQESRTPLGAASRLGYPPACRSAPSQVLSLSTSPDARAFGAVAGIPRQLWGLIPPVTEATNFPFPLDPDGRNPLRSANLHPLRGVAPPASPFVPNQVALVQQPILSWCSSPLEPSPPQPRILYPPWRKARTRAGTLESQPTTKRTSQPSQPGDAFPQQ